MKTKKIRTVAYQYGDEEKIKSLIFASKEPILIKIKNFTDEFSLDYFEKYIKAATTYSIFEQGHLTSNQAGDFASILSKIKNNSPYRIFGQYLSRQQSAEIEKHVPLWQTIPFRPRYFNKKLKVAYFFGGKGSSTSMHFDREHCCNLHLCLSGQKEVLLFTQDQSDKLYKLPFVGNSLIDFSYPWATLQKQFPRLNHVEGYKVLLERGDMLFMPRNCWHYTEYLNASSAATYVFYPKKFFQIYGYVTGYFFWGYTDPSIFKVFKGAFYNKLSQHYALSTGKIKSALKIIEAITYIFILPIVSLGTIISYRLKPRRVTF